MKVNKSSIDFSKALYLDANAYKLLATMYYIDVESSDDNYLALMEFGLSTYKKAKRVLVSEGWLQVTQIDRHIYEYKIGEPT